MPIDLNNLYDANGDPIDPDELPTPANLRNHIKTLEAKLDEVAKPDPNLERKLAFYEAGVNPTSERDQYFVRGYDGALEADSIKSAYEVFSGTAPNLNEPSRVAAAASGASALPGGSGDQRWMTDPEGYQQALDGAGASQDRVLGVMREWGSPIAEIDD